MNATTPFALKRRTETRPEWVKGRNQGLEDAARLIETSDPMSPFPAILRGMKSAVADVSAPASLEP